MTDNDHTVLYFARIKSNENKRSFYKIGKTQTYEIFTGTKWLQRNENNRYNELKREFGNEFSQNEDIIIVRQIIIPTSMKVLCNSEFREYKLSSLTKPNGGFFDDCYMNSFQMFEILMKFFDKNSDKINDMINTNYMIGPDDKEYYKDNLISDTFYTAEDYLNKDEEEWSSDEDDGSHLGSDCEYDSSDDFIASDDDLELDNDSEYVPKKKQKREITVSDDCINLESDSNNEYVPKKKQKNVIKIENLTVVMNMYQKETNV